MSTAADLFVLTWPAAVGVAAAGAVLAHGTIAPSSSFWGPVLSRAPFGDGRGVALTFDDGPTPGATDRALDILGELRVRAAFFVVGRNARQQPRLVERMHAEGHLVANHTLDHSHYGLFRRNGYWRRQMAETDETVRQIIGRRPALFRPPMGIKTGHVTHVAAALGHTVVTWTRRAFDGIGASPQRIVQRLAPRARAGDILLLHDGLEPHALRRDASPTVAALRPLIEQLRARGLEPRPLDVMLALPGYQPN
jgi:peptidoglycan/xylan/chitin deacetylase (PgdA/CDA1 family)